MKPKIVCPCGSTRFVAEFALVNQRETLAGNAVFSVGVYKQVDGVEVAGELKDRLNALHRAKIEMADEVVVVNPFGYIGEGTRDEMAYAVAMGKNARFAFLTPYEFHRGDVFYILDLSSDACAVSNAKLNPGTTLVVNTLTKQEVWNAAKATS